jgi:hypothetical protein
MIALTQIRMPSSAGRAYYDTKIAAGKTHNEAMRCLKRRLADHVWRRMIRDEHASAADPGAHMGTTLQSSAAGSTRPPALRTSHFQARLHQLYDYAIRCLTNTEEPSCQTPLLVQGQTLVQAP